MGDCRSQPEAQGPMIGRGRDDVVEIKPAKKNSQVSLPGCLLAEAIRNYFFLFTAALKAAPAVKRGTVAAAIFNFSPVRGFLPTRAARLAALKVPKPINCTSCFLATVLVMISTSALTARPAAALDMSVSLANASISSALFKIFLQVNRTARFCHASGSLLDSFFWF